MYVNHQLYTSEDFCNMSGEEQENSSLAKLVLDGGLAICKVCGEGEAGLDNSCIKPAEKIELYCNERQSDGLKVAVEQLGYEILEEKYDDEGFVEYVVSKKEEKADG